MRIHHFVSFVLFLILKGEWVSYVYPGCRVFSLNSPVTYIGVGWDWVHWYCFYRYLAIPSVTKTLWRWILSWKQYGRLWLWPDWRYSLGFCVDTLEKITKTQRRRGTIWDWNRGFSILQVRWITALSQPGRSVVTVAAGRLIVPVRGAVYRSRGLNASPV